MNRIVAHKATISAIAMPMWCSRKKIQLQPKFKTSCTQKKRRPRDRLLELGAVHTIHPATAMAAYKIVHTGPNIWSGGLKPGLARVAYQVPMEES